MAIGVPTDSSIFDSIAGLPLHPLVVHVAVVVLPVAALALIVLALVPRWRANFAAITTLSVLVGSAATLVAKESGEALAKRLGTPADHAAWADRLFIAAAVLSVLTVIWYLIGWTARRQARAAAQSSATATRPARSRVALVTDLLVVVASVVVLFLAVMTGHSGATAVWGSTLSATNVSATTAPATTTAPGAGTPATDGTSGTATQGTSTQGTSTQGTSTQPATTSSAPTGAAASTAADGSPIYSLATVGQHASADSCWVAISEQVYDLTRWISQHPGGPDKILAICGTDASAAFSAQHAGQRAPAADLATFRIGSLG